MTDPMANEPDEPSVKEYDARQLLGPKGHAMLRLDGALYTLRITRTGKLILTK